MKSPGKALVRLLLAPSSVFNLAFDVAKFHEAPRNIFQFLVGDLLAVLVVVLLLVVGHIDPFRGFRGYDYQITSPVRTSRLCSPVAPCGVVIYGCRTARYILQLLVGESLAVLVGDLLAVLVVVLLLIVGHIDPFRGLVFYLVSGP